MAREIRFSTELHETLNDLSRRPEAEITGDISMPWLPWNACDAMSLAAKICSGKRISKQGEAYAPWPTRSQIKQNLRPPRGVAAVFGDEVLREQTLTVVAPIWPNESN